MWLVNLCLNELKRRKRMKKSEISPDEFSNVSDDDMPITGQLQNNKRFPYIYILQLYDFI